MSAQDELRIRNWSKGKFHDPERVLRELRAIEKGLDPDLSPKARALRTKKLRKFGEFRQAALFCYGMGQLTGAKIFFSPQEDEAHDYVTLQEQDGTQKFAPLQLKEIVPEHLNPNASLKRVLEDLRKYSSAKDTVVAIYINRRGQSSLRDIEVPPLKVGALWLFWSASPDASKWKLLGDLLIRPECHEFDYPA